MKNSRFRAHIEMLKTTALASETSLDVLTESGEEITYAKPRFSPDRFVLC